MKRYFNHIKDTKNTHERRQHALAVAGVLTGIVFMVWVTTLSVRFATSDAELANIQNNTDQTAAVAAQGASFGAQENSLIVSTSTTNYGQRY